MIRNISPYELGATLYMPVTKADAIEYVSGIKLPNLRSMVLCLEDALLDADVPYGLSVLSQILPTIGHVKSALGVRSSPLVFVRPRNLEMAKEIVEMRGIGNIDGFVAPKIKPGDHEKWVEVIRGTDLYLMPTLETKEVFDVGAMINLKDEFLSCAPERVLALRIGGNDLMSAMGLRRAKNTTIYDGPLFYTICMLLSVMKPSGFSLTSPVFEHIEDIYNLEQEVRRDVQHGFVGKTVIHPSQIGIVQNSFKVSKDDFESAKKILDIDAAAVFKFGGSMCEPATHRNWATSIHSRANVHGLEKFSNVSIENEVMSIAG